MEFLAFASFALLVLAWIFAPSKGEIIVIEQKKAA